MKFSLNGIRQWFNEEAMPVGGKIFKMHTSEFANPVDYRYESMLKMLEDERVYSIVALVASAVQKAYVGPYILPSSKYVDKKLDPKEMEALNLSITFLRNINAQKLFFDFAWDVVLHGDVFEVFIKDGTKGIVGLQSLPLNAVYVVEDKNDDKTRGRVVYKENFICVKPNQTLGISQIQTYERKNVMHISYHNRGVWKKDINGTLTFGIYSIPPLACVQRLVDWKKKTIENDIIWKNKLLPKIHWTLKMPSVVPSKYIGTQSSKITQARTDGKAIISDFKESVQVENVDQDYITSDSVVGKFLEANSTNYKAPNETITQINDLINTPMGIPNGFLGGKQGSSQGMEMSAIFGNFRILKITNDIADEFVNALRSHLRIVSPSLGEDVINRVCIHTNASLSTEKYELAKMALAMAESKAYTREEIRAATGYEPLPQVPDELFLPVSTDVKSTRSEMIKTIKSEESGSGKNNVSPEAERNGMGS